MDRNRLRRPLLVIFFSCLTSLVFLGCASIPPEAPELSAELGNRISAIEDVHISLLHHFFDQKRAEVDRFIQEEWVPVFAEEVFRDPKMQVAWETIVNEKDPEQRLKFLIAVGPRLQERINIKRLELIQPLDSLERQIEQKLREEYIQARSINNSITSFLLSASKVSENRNRYLNMIGISDEKIGPVIEKLDETVTNLVMTGRGVKDKIESTEEYLTKLRELEDILKRK